MYTQNQRRRRTDSALLYPRRRHFPQILHSGIFHF